MVDLKIVLTGKVSSIGKKSFKNDGEETITHYLNFINNDENGNIDVIKVKILDDINDEKVEELRKKYVGKLIQINCKEFLNCNNNRVNKYLSCNLENIKEE